MDPGYYNSNPRVQLAAQLADRFVLLVADPFRGRVQFVRDFRHGPTVRAQFHDLLLPGAQQLLQPYCFSVGIRSIDTNQLPGKITVGRDGMMNPRGLSGEIRIDRANDDSGVIRGQAM